MGGLDRRWGVCVGTVDKKSLWLGKDSRKSAIHDYMRSLVSPMDTQLLIRSKGADVNLTGAR